MGEYGESKHLAGPEPYELEPSELLSEKNVNALNCGILIKAFL